MPWEGYREEGLPRAWVLYSVCFGFYSAKPQPLFINFCLDLFSVSSGFIHGSNINNIKYRLFTGSHGDSHLVKTSDYPHILSNPYLFKFTCPDKWFAGLFKYHISLRVYHRQRFPHYRMLGF